MPKFHEVTLETACDGAAKDLFQRALNDVLANIQDVNTDPEASRKIALIFTFHPGEDRSSSTLALECKTKLVGVSSIGGSLYITKEHGIRKAYTSSARQEPLFPSSQEHPAEDTAAV